MSKKNTVRKTTGWAYGLVEEKFKDSDGDVQKRLILCEIYFDKDSKPIMIAEPNWKEIRDVDEFSLIISDLKGQFNGKGKYDFKFEDIYKTE